MSAGSGSKINYQQASNSAGQSPNTPEANIVAYTQTMDPSSKADVIKLQSLMQQWTNAVNLEVEKIKNVGDALKGLIQKMEGVVNSDEVNKILTKTSTTFITGDKSSIAKGKAEIVVLMNTIKMKVQKS